jgi:hypothetical protein
MPPVPEPPVPVVVLEPPVPEPPVPELEPPVPEPPVPPLGWQLTVRSAFWEQVYPVTQPQREQSPGWQVPSDPQVWLAAHSSGPAQRPGLPLEVLVVPHSEPMQLEPLDDSPLP